MNWLPRFIDATFSDPLCPEGGSIQYPKPGHIISRDKEGRVASIYSDNIWDYKAYSRPSNPVRLNFESQLPERNERNCVLIDEIISEMKLIIFYFIYEPSHSGGKRQKLVTLSKYFSTLRGLSVIAHNDNKTLSELHESNFSFAKILSSCMTNPNSFRKGVEVIQFARLSIYIKESFNIELPRFLTDKNIERLDRSLDKNRSNYQQHQGKDSRTPLIPTRIYANLIAQCSELVVDFLEVQERIGELYKSYYSNPFYWASPLNGSTIYQRWQRLYSQKKMGSLSEIKPYLVSPKQAIDSLELTGFFEKHPVKTKSTEHGWVAVERLLSATQDAARILIFVYTGMRHHECEILQPNCVGWIDIPSIGKLPLVMAHTSKMTNSNYSESKLPWATCEEVLPAIKAAEALRSIRQPNSTYLFFGDSNDGSIRNMIDSKVQREILFKVLSETNPEALRVTEEDIVELESFDAFRDWRNDKKLALKAGEYWHLTKHQFRRSTAVYSARSGKVSLPSLKFQFKHLSESMTMLYRENSSMAKNILRLADNQEGHLVISDYMNEIRLIEALEFDEQVVQAKSKLTGGGGSRLQQEKNIGTAQWLDGPEEIHKLMMDGTISYRRTGVGGCLSAKMCWNFNVDEVIPCVKGCKDAVLGGDDEGERLRRYKEGLKIELEYMDKDHPSAKLAQQEIEFIELKLISEDD